MATNYPGAVDSLTNPAAGDALNSPSHAGQHTNANDAIEAIETELGTTPSGSESTVAARLTAIESGARMGTGSIGATALANDAVDTAALQDGAVTSAKIADGTITSTDVAAGTFAAFGTVGNLLTANQASVETDTTGWNAYNVTLAKSSAQYLHGSASLLVTSMAVGGCTAYTMTGTSGIPIEGEALPSPRTFMVKARSASGTPPIRATITWYDAGGSPISQDSGPYITTSASAWTTHSATFVPPSSARFAGCEVTMNAANIGDAVYVDCASFHKGAGGVWAMPGTPIVGGSHIATNGAYVTSGTVAPEGVVTAPPLSRYQQTSGAMTVSGAMEWVKATGTGDTGWVAGAEADTGWRDVSSLLVNSWTGKLLLRRVGKTIHVGSDGTTGLIGTSASGNTFVTLPAGFRSAYNSAVGAYPVAGPLLTYTEGQDVRVVCEGYNTGALSTTGRATYHNIITILTDDTWPASLPGTAA